MTSSGSLRVVFRAAAGSRRGFGHLVRCLSLARALGVRPLVALRGSKGAMDVALALGADVIASPSPRRLRALAPDVVVVDDPSAVHARPWIAAARRAGAIVVTIHDLGIGAPDGDIVIDGSATNTARPRKGAVALTGSRFAVLDPRILRSVRTLPLAARALAARENSSQRVVIALGGGPHAHTVEAIASAIVASNPRAEVRIVAGFVARPRAGQGRVRWTRSTQGLAPELAKADVAIVGGGMSLYEACAMGVPAVAVPVVSAQQPTVEAFARRGAAVPALAEHAAGAAVKLLNSPRLRETLAQRSTELVDGMGAWRAAAAVVSYAERGSL